MGNVLLVNANSLTIPLADKSVNCVVTSPPYYGLRDYGTDGQLGLEETPEQYITSMVAVFREVWRVLRDDGILWLNIGDSYATSPAGNKTWGDGVGSNKHYQGEQIHQTTRKNFGDCKPKDLIGIPWLLAFALRADGWYLRSDIIWHKPNPMPESVTDRPTKAHEYIFLLSKSGRYYYDNEAVREDAGGWNGSSFTDTRDKLTKPNLGMSERIERAGRNRRTVWTIATEPTSEAHFATYPRALVEPCIKAGCPVGGVVLDPFAGSGTTGIVARALGRFFVGLDLSFDYLSQVARKRLKLDALDAWANGIQAQDKSTEGLPLWSLPPKT